MILIVLGKSYKLVDFLACLCMSVGLILFTLADSTVQPEFNHTGNYTFFFFLQILLVGIYYVAFLFLASFNDQGPVVRKVKHQDQ